MSASRKIAVVKPRLRRCLSRYGLAAICHLLSRVAKAQALKVRNLKLVEEDGLKRLAGGRECRVDPIGKDCEERHRRMMIAQ